MIDCHTRELLGWQLSRSGKATTAASALEQALIANAAFLPGDLAKAAAAVALTHALAKAYPVPFTHARRKVARRGPGR